MAIFFLFVPPFLFCKKKNLLITRHYIKYTLNGYTHNWGEQKCGFKEKKKRGQLMFKYL